MFNRRFREMQDILDPIAHEFEVMAKNNEVLVVSLTGKATRDDFGGLPQIHCVFSNITEHKRAELSLRKQSAAVEQNPAPVMITDTGVSRDAATLNHVFDPFFTTEEISTG